MISIAHVITGLEAGGAETMLFKLLSRIDRDRFASRVIGLGDRGPMAERIESLGVEVRTLGERRGFPDPRVVWRLDAEIRTRATQLVQTWLYRADLLGGAIGVAARRVVVWNIRCSDSLAASRSKAQALSLRALGRLSRLPDAVVVNSAAGRHHHERLGYRPRRWETIPNGFDPEEFRPDPAARASVRRELGLAPETPLVGLVARFDPLKDHATFLAAAQRMHREIPASRFLLVGAGTESWSRVLGDLLPPSGLADAVLPLGTRADVPRLTSALDLAVNCSISEGFPNAVGEAMACGVPCVVTDVGDSRALVGGTCPVVPPRSPEELARACLDILRLDPYARISLGRAARRRIIDSFSIDRVVRRYEDLYEELHWQRQRRVS